MSTVWWSGVIEMNFILTPESKQLCALQGQSTYCILTMKCQAPC